MVDMKKVGAKGVVKAPAALKSVSASVKPKATAEQPKAKAAVPQSKAAQPQGHVSVAKASVAAPTPAVEAKPVVAVALVPTPVEVKVEPTPAPPVATPAPPVAAPVEAMASTVAPKATALRQAMGEAVTASAHGALAVNDKVIEALQTQSHAALDLWRNAVSTPHLSDVFRLQSNGARQAYETASAQWKDIAETTAHWFTKTVEPLSSAMSDRKR